MASGFLLIVVTGICWAGLAGVMAAGMFFHAHASKIQAYSALLLLGCCGWCAIIFGGTVPSHKIWLQLCCLVAAGAFNYYMLNLVQLAMNSGKKGVIWAFAQSSMIWPFLMGICCFREPAAPSRFAGIVLIVFGLILFAREKDNSGDKGRWLLPTIGAFMLSGLAQCCSSIPSYFQITSMSALRRMMLVQCGILCSFFLDSLIHPRLDLPKIHTEKAIWLLAGIFGGLNLIALIFFYNGMNRLADAKCASAGYPVAQGLGVILFFLYGCGKKAPSLLSFCGFLLILAGIAALALSCIAFRSC